MSEPRYDLGHAATLVALQESPDLAELVAQLIEQYHLDPGAGEYIVAAPKPCPICGGTKCVEWVTARARLAAMVDG